MTPFRLINIIILVTIGGCCAARSNSLSDSLGTVELNDKETHMVIGKFIDFLEDPSRQLTLEKVFSPPFANQFIRSNQNIPNFGFSPSDFWIRLRIKNNSSENHEWLLETGNPLISSVQ
ncbi:MAG TPA: 7TM-DISM domain-containing protein, partial [Cyclobacteriaceae bacterium]